MDVFEEQKGEYLISTDKRKLQLEVVHQFLSRQSYWSKNIPFETVRKSAENSLTFGIYCDGSQVAYARVISDYATIAYLGDVFVSDEHRKKGLSKCLLKSIRNHPELQGLRRWILLTKDAHELYRQFGWKEIKEPELWMEIKEFNEYPAEPT